MEVVEPRKKKTELNLKPDLSSGSDSSVVTKTGRGLVTVIIVLTISFIVALVGVGVMAWQGAWKDTRISELRNEILSFHQEDWAGNPLLEATDPDRRFVINLKIQDEDSYLDLSVVEGKVFSCQYERGGLGSRECNFNGLEGEIYKVLEINTGDETPEMRNVAFIMTDGRVYYTPIVNAFLTNDWSVRGTLLVDKPVIDIVEVEIATKVAYSSRGGFLVVFNDGTFAEFTRAMVSY